MKHSGFTLVELLVVIVVILSITALLFPAVLAARNCAKAAACSANMGRLLNAMSAYESMKEIFPYGCNASTDQPPGGYPGNLSYDKARWWWFNYIDVYSGDPSKARILQCPAKHLTNRTLQLNILCGNYGVNLSICKEGGSATDTEFKGSPLARSDIRNSSDTILLVDSGYSIITWWHATASPPGNITATTPIENTAYIPGLSINSQRKFRQGQESDAIDGRHPGKTVNTGFVDGHVTRFDAEEMLVEKIDKTYRSKNILWQPK